MHSASMPRQRDGRDRPSSTEAGSIPNDGKPQPVKTSAKKLLDAQSRLLQVSLVARLASITLLILTSAIQQAFDTSHHLVSFSLDPSNQHSLSAGPLTWLLALVRWDSVHFLASASASTGYTWEQTL